MPTLRILWPDMMAGDELRAIEWDPEAGTVAGEHSAARDIAARISGPLPIDTRGAPTPRFILRDPRHNLADLLVVIRSLALPDRGRARLPDGYADTRPTPPEPEPPLPPGAVN